MEAVKQDGFALEYVKRQTHKLCLEAIKQDGHALNFVKKQTPKICIEAIKQNVNHKRYIKIPLTDEIISEIIFQSI